MMGRNATQTQLWVEPVNLSKRIPEDHLLRKINKVLNLDFVYQEVADKYGRNGNVSVDPAIIVKMMLLLFLDDVASERELMRTIPMRIDYLWFLGYGLEDEIPHHSVLSKARNRWGYEVFEKLFTETVSQCCRAGLIEGKKLHMDSSVINANASNSSIVQMSPEAIRAVREAFIEQHSKLEPMPVESKTSADDNDQTGGSSTGINGRYASTTDPDATITRKAGEPPRARYKAHRAIDDQCGVITAVISTTGMIEEGQMLRQLVDAHQANTETKPRVIIGDSKYGSTENFIYCAQEGIRSHMADLRSKQKIVRTEGIFGHERFVYDAQKDRYICPAGKELYPRKFVESRGHIEYIAPRPACENCTLKTQCTRGKVRTLKRYPEQELLDMARKQSHGPAAKRDRKRRSYLMEGSFADAANNHGFKRSRWRGLWRQAIQDYLIAALQNLRILLGKVSENGRDAVLLLRYVLLELWMQLVLIS